MSLERSADKFAMLESRMMGGVGGHLIYLLWLLRQPAL